MHFNATLLATRLFFVPELLNMAPSFVMTQAGHKVFGPRCPVIMPYLFLCATMSTSTPSKSISVVVQWCFHLRTCAFSSLQLNLHLEFH